MDELREEILYIEADEEITEVIERLRTVTHTAVRLVVPKGALILQSLVSLKLLAKEARQIPVDVALVTQDDVGQHVAKLAGLTLYARPKDLKPLFQAEIFARQPLSPPSGETQSTASRDDASEDLPHDLPVHHYRDQSPHPRDREVRQDSVARSSGRIRGSWGKRLMIGLLLVGFGFAGWLIFLELAPRASLTLFVEAQPIKEELEVVADTSITEIIEEPARIPAERLEAEVRAEAEVPASGKKEIGEKAQFTLPLFNYWDANPQTIATGTTFTVTDGTEFAATSDAIIPGATTTLREGKVVTTPGTTSVPIEAKVAGPNGNGKSGRFTIPTLPQVRQDKIYGESTTATTGGTSREIVVVSSADLEGLKTTVQTNLDQSARETLLQQADGSRLLAEAIKLEILEETFSASLDQETEKVSLIQKARVIGFVFSDDDLKQVTVSQLAQRTPTGQVIVPSDRDQILTSAKQLKLDAGQLEIETVFSTYRAPELKATDLADEIGGLEVTAAREKLLVNPIIREVGIAVRPRWLTTLPKHASQISLEVNYLFDTPEGTGDEAS